MADAPAADPYATAKSNLRDTIKWLATSLSAIGAAVIAGASINGLAALKGATLLWAAVLGAIGLGGILAAIAVLVRLLTSNVFYFSDLKPGNPIATEIDNHASDILSPQTPTIDKLVEFREDAVRRMSAASPGDPAYEDAFKRWAAANDLISRITNLAQFLSLRLEFEKRQKTLFLLAVFIIVTLGLYALIAGGKSPINAELERKVVFRPGVGWGDAASSFARACGTDPLSGTMTSTKTFEGWVAVRFSAPGKCSGLELPVPAALVTITGP